MSRRTASGRSKENAFSSDPASAWSWTSTFEVGDVAQALLVSAEVPLLQQSRGTVAFNLEQQRVVTLPLDGRNFVRLLALAPGVTLPPGSAFPRINGGRPRVSEYLYDGISVLQPEPGQPAYYPVIDAIAEFRVETNAYGAEYGRANGGIILVTQKSGANDLHGTLFEFLRNEDLNARNLFASSGVLFRRVPSATAFSRSRFTTLPPGVPFENGAIPRDRFDPVAAEAMQRYPLPNVFVNGSAATANNYRRVGIERIGQDQFDTRLDHLFSVRGTAFSDGTRIFGTTPTRSPHCLTAAAR